MQKKQEMFKEYPDVVDVEMLCKMLGGISRKLAYRLLATGELRSVRVGRSYRIPKCCVIEYLTGQIETNLIGQNDPSLPNDAA